MSTLWKDPTIPAGESTEATLARLSKDIASLSGLIDQAEGYGRFRLVGLFSRARLAKIKEAHTYGVLER